MMHDILVKVIRTWALKINAEDRDLAEHKADLMEVSAIENEGSLKLVKKEFAERCLESEEPWRSRKESIK